MDSAVSKLCDGEHYLTLSFVERLSILRLLMEASYDTQRIYSVVSDNINSRINATKALDAEEKRAKKETREEMLADEAAARDRLAADVRHEFIQKRRQEIVTMNDDLEEDFVQNLTEEEVAEFDDETKEAYENLPDVDSFGRAEVQEMVRTIQEEVAFDATHIQVMTLEEILARDQNKLDAMENKLAEKDEVDIYQAGLDREATERVQDLRRNYERFARKMLYLPQSRRDAVENLKDAMESGTVKAIKAAIKTARQAELQGTLKADGDNDDDDDVDDNDEDYEEEDREDNIWALDTLRDTVLELKNAERKRRVTEAKKDLVAKLNKCFVRTMPLGMDRHMRKYWHFEFDPHRIWVQEDLDFDLEQNPPDTPEIIEEEDIIELEVDDPQMLDFSRKEYSNAGSFSATPRSKWTSYVSDRKLRLLVKCMDEKGIREFSLKERLRMLIEDMSGNAVASSAHKNATSSENSQEVERKISGDNTAFRNMVEESSDIEDIDLLSEYDSAISHRVRVKLAEYSYVTGTVVEWSEDRDMRMYRWHVIYDDGTEVDLEPRALLEGLIRFYKRNNMYDDYWEPDSPFWAYRNSIGKYCGRAAEAHNADRVINLARSMIKKEQELYAPLKNQGYHYQTSNTWGGRDGMRNTWIATLRDYGDNLETVRQCLSTLEKAFFEMSGGFGDDHYEDEVQPASLEDIMHVSLRAKVTLTTGGPPGSNTDKSLKMLWFSLESRQVFLGIVQTTPSLGILALALDLLVENCRSILIQTSTRSYDNHNKTGLTGRVRREVYYGEM